MCRALSVSSGRLGCAPPVVANRADLAYSAGPDIFKFYDEGSNKCSDTFTSDGGLASVANSNLSVTINSCTSTRGDIDQVDTVARLVYLSLAFTAVAFACTLSVLVLSMQDAEPDLQLAAVYAVFLDLLGGEAAGSSALHARSRPYRTPSCRAPQLP